MSVGCFRVSIMSLCVLLFLYLSCVRVEELEEDCTGFPIGTAVGKEFISILLSNEFVLFGLVNWCLAGVWSIAHHLFLLYLWLEAVHTSHTPHSSGATTTPVCWVPQKLPRYHASFVFG